MSFTFCDIIRILTNCFPNKKLKRFIKKGQIKINKELDYMKVIKHVKENKLRFYPNREKVDLTVNIDESSSEDLPIIKSMVRRISVMNTPD